MVAHLWRASPKEHPIGTATTGSSEGIILGALALKRNWQNKRKAAGMSTENPNIIMCARLRVASMSATDTERIGVPTRKSASKRPPFTSTSSAA
jgi:glutamate/tyrosine decarboxylase-like PLP-dependent enzyme